MGEVKVIQVQESIFADNDRTAEAIREQMTRQKTFFLNVMSSPGSGKTTTLITLINRLKDRRRIGVMDVDITSTEDAQRVADGTGVPALQIHNGGLCHIDADMVSRTLAAYDTKDFDLLILENIGNLVCPAEFDTGAHLKTMILSIPEGDDKPLKYPLMFETVDAVLVSKIDAKEVFDFDEKRFENNLRIRNQKAPVFYLSNLNKEGIEAWTDYLINKIEEFRKS